MVGVTLACILERNLWAALPLGLLSMQFLAQTGKVRFVFDDKGFEIKRVHKGNDEILDPARENLVVGGKNRWDYSAIESWDFFPSYHFPIIVYFKENQSPRRQDGSAQLHFFPVLIDGKRLYEVMNERMPSTQGEGGNVSGKKWE